MTLTKAGNDSYTWDPKGRKMVGSVQCSNLSKKNMRGVRGLEYLYYQMHMAKELGYDYVILDDSRTNSGRPEAVKSTTRGISIGRKIEFSEKFFQFRGKETPLQTICIYEVWTPTGEIKRYNKLPLFIEETKQIGLLEDLNIPLVKSEDSVKYITATDEIREMMIRMLKAATAELESMR